MTAAQFLTFARLFPEPLLLLSAQGQVAACNAAAAAVLGRTPGELQGQPLTALATAPPEQVTRYLQDCSRTSTFVLGALTLRAGNGQSVLHCRCEGARAPTVSPGDAVHILLRLKPAEDASRSFLLLNQQIQALRKEIRQRRQAEQEQQRLMEELRRGNEELQHFAYIVSHDLNEPLRMVSSYVQLLAQRYHGRLDADADDYIHFAVDGARRMQALIDSLLDYARVGGKAQEFTAVACEAVLARVLQDLQLRIDEAGAAVTYDPLPTVYGDAQQFGLLLQNLLSNALKFRSAAPPRIHVSAVRTGRGWRFTVRDNGIGIDPAHRERIFQVFQRLHARDEYPGTGIGLAICKKIVERHGGRIWVESQAGAGATFIFTISDRMRANHSPFTIPRASVP
jgi:signal transduction histidine kinase